MVKGLEHKSCEVQLRQRRLFSLEEKGGSQETSPELPERRWWLVFSLKDKRVWPQVVPGVV